MVIKNYYIHLFVILSSLLASMIVVAARHIIGLEVQNFALMVIAAGAYLYFIIFIHIRMHKLERSKFWLPMIMLLYIAIPFLTSPLSIYPERSKFYAAAHFLFILGAFVFPFLLLNRMSYKVTQGWQKFIVVTDRFIFIYLLINVLWFYVVEGQAINIRLSGFQSQANSFGSIVFVAFIGFHIEVILCRKKFAGLFLFFIIAFSLLTQSRTLLLSIIAYYLIFLFLGNGTKKQYAIAAILISLLMAGFLARHLHSVEYRRNVDPVEELDDYGGSMRFFIWTNALNYWINEGFVLLGTGYETGYKVNKNTATGILYMKRQGLNEPVGISLHSGIIKILITQGVVGILLFATTQILLIKMIWNAGKKIRGVGSGLIISGILMDFANVSIWSALGSLQTITYFILLLGILMAASQVIASQNQRSFAVSNNFIQLK